MKDLENTASNTPTVSLYDEYGSEDLRYATLHPNSKFILPVFSADDVYNKYMNLIKSKKAYKIFSEEYLAIEARNVDNIELVYVERIRVSASANTTHNYSYQYMAYENGDSRYSYVSRGFDTARYQGSDSTQDCHRLNWKVGNFSADIGKAPTYSYDKLPDKNVRLFRADSYRARNRAENSAINEANSQVFLVGKRQDPYETLPETTYSSSVDESTFFPVWIITTHKGGRVYHSFYNGLTDIYEIDGDSRKNDVKNTLYRVWTKFRCAVIALATLAAFAFFLAKVIYPNVFPILKYFWTYSTTRTSDIWETLVRMIPTAIFFFLCIFLFAELVAGIIAPIFISWIGSYIDDPYYNRLHAYKWSSSFVSIIRTEVKLLLELVLIIIILGVLLVLMFAWVYFVEETGISDPSNW